MTLTDCLDMTYAVCQNRHMRYFDRKYKIQFHSLYELLQGLDDEVARLKYRLPRAKGERLERAHLINILLAAYLRLPEAERNRQIMEGWRELDRLRNLPDPAPEMLGALDEMPSVSPGVTPVNRPGHTQARRVDSIQEAAEEFGRLAAPGKDLVDPGQQSGGSPPTRPKGSKDPRPKAKGRPG